MTWKWLSEDASELFLISAPLWAAGGGAMEQGGASAGPAVPSAGKGGVNDMALPCRVGFRGNHNAC